MNHLNTALSLFEPGKVHLIPVNEDKSPACRSWKQYQESQTKEDINQLFSRDCWGIAMLTGVGGLEVIDFDSDDWTGGVLHKEWMSLAAEYIEESIRSVCVSTPSGGMHFMYRCAEIDGNQKLAHNDQRQVVIETRGVGGYVVIPPSPGYRFIQGDPTLIPVVDPETRRGFMQLSTAFNMYEEPTLTPQRTSSGFEEGSISPADAYNQVNDYMSVVWMLEQHGWKVVRDAGARVLLRRPGKNKGHSADIKKENALFKCWSANGAPFVAEKAYSPFAVYSLLEHGGDDSAAAKLLYSQGYGDRVQRDTSFETETKVEETPQLISVGDVVDDTVFTMHYLDGNKEVEVAGPGSIIVITGDTGAGKSTIQDLMCMTAMNEVPYLGLMVNTGGRRVVRFDTEQESFWLERSKKLVLDSCNYDVDKRRFEYYTIEHILRSADKNQAIKDYVERTNNIGMLFIDNIVDLLGKVNDEEASLEFISSWKHLAKEHGFILVVTLHETRSSGYAQGWLGKILEQRAAWVIRMTKKKNETTEYFVAENRKKRGRPIPEPIRFQRGRHGEINQFRSEAGKFSGI